MYIMDFERRVLLFRLFVMRYEVFFVEDMLKKGFFEEWMIICFYVYDELILQLGVYKKVLKMFWDELYEVVYSNEYIIVVFKKGKSKMIYI